MSTLHSSSSSSSTTSAPSLPRSLPSDIRQFLLGYPSQHLDSTKSANLLFFQNKGPGRPSKLSVVGMLQALKGDYDELERSHSFIQVIMPIREQGVNWEAQPLQPHEIEAIKADPEAMERRMEAYRLMLDFYGLTLVSPTTGLVTRKPEPLAPAEGSWLKRYANLMRNSHNWLRITRILKSNSEFGQEHLNAPLLLHLLAEQSHPTRSERQLHSPALIRSMDGYWRWCIRNHEEREFVAGTIERVREGAEWNGEMVKEVVERRERTGSFLEKEAGKGESEGR